MRPCAWRSQQTDLKCVCTELKAFRVHKCGVYAWRRQHMYFVPTHCCWAWCWVTWSPCLQAIQQLIYTSSYVIVCAWRRQHTDFLPIALVLGLVPGRPVTVPIVVVAEDGVTSLRYYVTVSRAPAPARPPALAPAPNPAVAPLGRLGPPLGFAADGKLHAAAPAAGDWAGVPDGGGAAGGNGTAGAGALQFVHGGARSAGLDLEAAALAAAADAAPKALPAGAHEAACVPAVLLRPGHSSR